MKSEVGGTLQPGSIKRAMDLTGYDKLINANGSGASNESCNSATGKLFLFVEITSFPAFACLLMLVCPALLFMKHRAWKLATVRYLHTFQMCFLWGYAATCASALVRHHLGVKLCQNVIIYILMTSSCLYLWLYLSALFLQKVLRLLPPENCFNGRIPRRSARALEVLAQAAIFVFVISGSAFEFMYILHDSIGGILNDIPYYYIFNAYEIFGICANVYLFNVFVSIAAVGLLLLKARKQLTEKNIKSFKMFMTFVKLPPQLILPLVHFDFIGFIVFSVFSAIFVLELTALSYFTLILAPENTRQIPPSQRRPPILSRAGPAERQPLLPSDTEQLNYGTTRNASSVQNCNSPPITPSSVPPRDSEHSSASASGSGPSRMLEHSSKPSFAHVEVHSPIPVSSRSPTPVANAEHKPTQIADPSNSPTQTVDPSRSPSQTADPSRSPTQTADPAPYTDC